MPQNTAVIWHLSLVPTTSTLFAPRFSIDHVVEGTIFIPVWSQFNINSGGISSIWTVVITSWRNAFFTWEKFFTACLLLDVVGFLGTKSILLKRERAQCLFNSILPPYSTSLCRLYASNRPLAAAIAILAVTGPPLARIFFKYNWSFVSRSSPSKTVLPRFFSGSFDKDSISPFFFSSLLPLETLFWLILPCFHLLNALASWRNDELLQQHN